MGDASESDRNSVTGARGGCFRFPTNTLLCVEITIRQCHCSRNFALLTAAKIREREGEKFKSVFEYRLAPNLSCPFDIVFVFRPSERILSGCQKKRKYWTERKYTGESFLVVFTPARKA